MSRVFFLLVLLAFSVEAQIYKWTDEKGRVQYGEKPPAGVKATPVRPPAPPAAAKPRAADDPAAQEAEFRRRQLERRQEENRNAREAQARQADCQRARDELSMAQGANLFRFEKGERVYLTEAERNSQLLTMRERVARHCR